MSRYCGMSKRVNRLWSTSVLDSSKACLNVKGKSNRISFVVAYAVTEGHISVRDKDPFLASCIPTRVFKKTNMVPGWGLTETTELLHDSPRRGAFEGKM